MSSVQLPRNAVVPVIGARAAASLADRSLPRRALRAHAPVAE
jgi:hypothetical protein